MLQPRLNWIIIFYLNVSASLTVGIPPVTHVDGTGVLAPIGRLGDIRYGLAAFLIKYHFTEWGRFQPLLVAA